MGDERRPSGVLLKPQTYLTIIISGAGATPLPWTKGRASSHPDLDGEIDLLREKSRVSQVSCCGYRWLPIPVLTPQGDSPL